MREQFITMPIMVKQSVHWDRTVPFSMLNEEWAQKNHSQSLQRLAERGGLGADEALAIMDKRPWRSIRSDLALEMLACRLDAAESV